jgi:D-glycero-alpha-D-manno-heptose-7-phosphate kinase
LIKFSGDDAFEVTNIAMTDEYLELLNAHSVLVYTGQQRDSTTVASAQVSNIDKNLGILAEMKSFVNEAVKLFNSQSSMREIGRLLNESWRAKSKLASNISNSEIERLYEAGIKCGAYGGKLLGAGAGGFLYFLADKEAQDRLKSVLTNSTLIPLRFGAEGSKIIHEG